MHGGGQTQLGQVEGSPFAKINSTAHLTAKMYRTVLEPKVTAIVQKTLSHFAEHHRVSCQPLSDAVGPHSHRSRSTPFESRNSDTSKKNTPLIRNKPVPVKWAIEKPFVNATFVH